MEKVFKCGVKRENGFLYFVDSNGNVAKVRRGESKQEIVCKNDGSFTKEAGYIYFVDKQGDVSRSKMKSFREYAEVREEIQLDEKKWIKGTITEQDIPNRKLLGNRFKDGRDLHK